MQLLQTTRGINRQLTLNIAHQFQPTISLIPDPQNFHSFPRQAAFGHLVAPLPLQHSGRTFMLSRASDLSAVDPDVGERCSISASKYMERYHLKFYLEDAVTLALETREENPLQTLAKYFRRVHHGQHCMHRKYSYIRETLHNRISFAESVVSFFSRTPSTEIISLHDHWQLCSLLCPDMLSVHHERAAAILSVSMVTPIPRSQVLSYWQLFFIYEEYLVALSKVFDECQAAASAMALTPENASAPQVVDRHTLLWNLRGLLSEKRWAVGFPSAVAMENVLQSASDSKFSSLRQVVAEMAASKMVSHAD